MCDARILPLILKIFSFFYLQWKYCNRNIFRFHIFEGITCFRAKRSQNTCLYKNICKSVCSHWTIEKGIELCIELNQFCVCVFVALASRTSFNLNIQLEGGNVIAIFCAFLLCTIENFMNYAKNWTIFCMFFYMANRFSLSSKKKLLTRGLFVCLWLVETLELRLYRIGVPLKMMR